MNLSYLLNGVSEELGNRVQKLITRDKYKGRCLVDDLEEHLEAALIENAFLSLPPIAGAELSCVRSEAKAILDTMGSRESKSSVYKHIIDSSMFEANSKLVSLALRTDILSLAARYFGSRPYLHGLRLLVTEPQGEEAISRDQLWHRDKYDDKILRLFVYLEDCDEATGPFLYCPFEFSQKIRRTYISRVDDSYMARRGFLNECESVTGDAGSVFLADVRRLVHCGSRIRSGRRLVFNAIYTSGNPWVTRSLDADLIRALKKRELTDLQMAALAD